MEVHHSCLVELSLGNHSVAVLGLAVGLAAAGLGEHMSAQKSDSDWDTVQGNPAEVPVADNSGGHLYIVGFLKLHQVQDAVACSVVQASSDLCNLPAVAQRNPRLPENQVEYHLWVLVMTQVGHHLVLLDYAFHVVELLGVVGVFEYSDLNLQWKQDTPNCDVIFAGTACIPVLSPYSDILELFESDDCFHPTFSEFGPD